MARPTTVKATSPFNNCCPGNTMGFPLINPCNFPNAIKLPVNVNVPINILREIVKIAKVAVESAEKLSEHATRADAPPPKPLNIATIAGDSARAGFTAFLGFMAIVSISLGVLNLLPVPLLDGGQIVYQLVELIKGSPVSERAMLIGQQVGVFLLFILMSFAFYNDITRMFS